MRIVRFRWARRHSVGEGQRSQFPQGPGIHLTFEKNDITQWIPPIDPAPTVELRMIHRIQPDDVLTRPEAQQKPYLLLADTARFGVFTLIAQRQVVAQPAAGTAKNYGIFRGYPDLFIQFAGKRVPCRFPRINPALRKLAPVGAAALRRGRPAEPVPSRPGHTPYV